MTDPNPISGGPATSPPAGFTLPPGGTAAPGAGTVPPYENIAGPTPGQTAGNTSALGSGLSDPKTLTTIVYACMAGGFVIGISPIVGVILAHLKLEETRGTIYYSHLQYQIRTFWITLLAGAVAGLLIFLLIGFLLLPLVGIWALYRLIRGFLALNEGRPIPDPTGLL